MNYIALILCAVMILTCAGCSGNDPLLRELGLSGNGGCKCPSPKPDAAPVPKSTPKRRPCPGPGPCPSRPNGDLK